jgi:hypothetical protein
MLDDRVIKDSQVERSWLQHDPARAEIAPDIWRKLRAFKHGLVTTAGTIESILKRDELIRPFIEDVVRRRGAPRQDKLKALRRLLPGANVAIARTNRKIVEISWLSPKPPILANPEHHGEKQDCVLVCFLAAYPTAARAVTAHSAWALEVPDHAACRFLQRAGDDADLTAALFAGGLSFVAAEAETVAALIGTDTSIYLKAGPGVFVGTVIGAKTTDGASNFIYGRVHTWLRTDMLKPDQVPLPRATDPEQTVAVGLWRWGTDEVPYSEFAYRQGR